jgi:uncharacterized protein (DUF1015 family)
MAEIAPIHAIHYDLERVGPFADLAAPPYDVIDDAGRSQLLLRSPKNIVEIDLPEPPADDPDGDRYANAAEILSGWLDDGTMVRDDAPSIWAMTQEYNGPGGIRMTRHGFLCRVRLAEYGSGIRAHERTQPGPKEDRLRLTRSTRCNLSPVFSLYDGDVWPTLAPTIEGQPVWAQVTDSDQTEHRIWQITDPEVFESVATAIADAEMLIADGHHRYETALTYRSERIEAVGEAGDADFVMMALVGLDDPGLTVFPTHRLLTEIAADEAKRTRLGEGMRELFDISRVEHSDLDPGDAEGIGVFGYLDSHHQQPMRLTLNEAGRKIVDSELGGSSDAYRDLDAAILEAVVFKHLLEMTEDDIAAKRGLAYTPHHEKALQMLDAGDADVAFLLRPTPVEAVKDVAAEGETMPPKSTYFFPKLLTGIALNPLG